MKNRFKSLDVFSVFLLLLGGINWGLIGVFDFDLINYVFIVAGAIARQVLYILIGLAAVYLLIRKIYFHFTSKSKTISLN